MIAPLFNKFDELPPGQARSDVLELARKAGVDVGHVYEVDASKSTTAINAYVNGLGSSKQVVLYDTLINDLNQGERRAVVAHELGHVHGNDIQRGLLFVAIVTPLVPGLHLRHGGAHRAPQRRRAGHAGVPARLRPGDRGHLVRDRDRRQPALARRRGARRHLLAPAHQRPAGA